MSPASDPETKDEIAKRAYAIWEEEGRPHGRDYDHWHRAESAAPPGSADTPELAAIPETSPDSEATLVTPAPTDTGGEEASRAQGSHDRRRQARPGEKGPARGRAGRRGAEARPGQDRFLSAAPSADGTGTPSGTFWITSAEPEDSPC